MMRQIKYIGMFSLLLVAGCNSSGSYSGGRGTGFSTDHSTAGGDKSPARIIVAYLDGKAVTAKDLRSSLFERSGSEILAEYVIDAELKKRMTQLKMRISDEDIAREKQIVLQALAPGNPNQAVRLMRQLRRNRGLGDLRFAAWLKRNASLRKLIEEQVEITDTSINEAYQIRYGKRYEVRLLVVDAVTSAATLANRARGGESFVDLAIAHSTDASRAQGGLVDPISPADPSWPGGIRKVISTLKSGQVSDPVALKNSFAVVRLERIIPASTVKLEAVKSLLEQRLRRSYEKLLMDQQVRAMLDQVDLLIVNRPLKNSWDQSKTAAKAKTDAGR